VTFGDAELLQYADTRNRGKVIAEHFKLTIGDAFDRAILCNWACGFFPGQTAQEALIGAHVRRILNKQHIY